RVVMPALLSALLLAPLAALPASAHATVEAAELETMVIEDEGTDLIDFYGGYDIVAVFLGAAHHPELGAGLHGDGLYLRIELYGKPTGPTAAMANTIRVTFSAGNASVDAT